MDIVLKICLLFLGCGATLLALSGDTIDKSELGDGDSLFPKFNKRGKLSIVLLLAALTLGIVDAYLSDASEQKKVDRLIANGEALETTIDRLGGIKDDLTNITDSQSDAIDLLNQAEKQITTTSERLEQNLETTSEVLGRSEAIEKNLLRMPRVIVSAEHSIDTPVTKLPVDHMIQCGDIFRFSIVSSDGISRDDLADWQLEIRIGEQKHRVYDLTGEIIAGGRDGQRHQILVTHPAAIKAKISYSIYEHEKGK